MKTLLAISKRLFLTLFLLCLITLPNINQVKAATLSSEQIKIQNALNSYQVTEPQTGCKACFQTVINATTSEEFNQAVTNKSTGVGVPYPIESCLGQLNCDKTFTSILSALEKYVKNSSPENFDFLMGLLVSGTPPVTTGCITDETNSQLQEWLKIIASHDLVAGAKASSDCANTNLTLKCLKESIIPSIKKTMPALIAGHPALADLYQDYLRLLDNFANCPNQTNFDTLNTFYNNYFVSKKEDIIYSAIGEDITKLEDKECLLNHEPSPCELDPNINWLNPLNSVIGGLFYVLYLISRGILVFILKVFEWFLNPQNFGGYINFLHDDIVTTLFEKIKNFAYLGLVLAMIFTALATIFRNEKFGWQKMLPRLLIVALLVNFALVISGILLDLSNYLSMASVYAFQSNISLSNLLVNCSICPTVKAIYKLGGAWNLARATGFGIVLTCLFIFQFFGLMMYVGSRIVTVLICLITSPVAFLTFAFPGGEKIWDFWRQRFQQALVVLPVICFTFYISLFFINTLASSIAQNIAPDSQGVAVTVMAYMIFISIFAQLTRYVANALGVEQVEKGFQMAKKAVTGAAMAGAAAVGGFALGKTVTSGGWKAVQENLKKSNVTPLYNLGNWMERQSKQVTQQKGAAVEEFLKTQEEEGIRHYMQLAQARGDKIGVAAALNELSARNKTEDTDFPYIQAVQDVPIFNKKALKKSNPYLLSKLDATSPDNLKKITNEIKVQHPTASPQEIQEFVNEIVEKQTWSGVITAVKKSPVSDLKEMNWKTVFQTAKAQKNPEYYEEFLYNLINSTTPEGLASIFQTLDKQSLDIYIQDLIQVVKKRDQVKEDKKDWPNANTIDHLLAPLDENGKGFGKSSWWRTILSYYKKPVDNNQNSNG